MRYINEDFPYFKLLERIIPEGSDDFKQKTAYQKSYKLYKDALLLNLSPALTQYLIYIEVKSIFTFTKELNDTSIKNILEATFFEEKIRKKVKELDFQSDYFKILKSLCIDIDNLYEYMENKQSYKVLRSYEKILDFLNNEGIENLSKDKLKLELESRYDPYSMNESSYYYRINNKVYKNKSNINPLNKTYIVNKSLICSYLISYLYDLMIDYYQKSGYFYREVDNGYKLFVLGDVSFLTYNNIEMKVKDLGYTYDYTDYEFWAIILNESNDLKDYVILENLDKIFKSDNLIICPYSNLDEAIYKYLNPLYTKNLTESIECLELEKSKGFDFNNLTDELETIDDKTYFINPRNYEKLKLDLSKSDCLSKLLKEKDKIKYIKKIIALYNGKRNKIINARNKKDFDYPKDLTWKPHKPYID